MTAAVPRPVVAVVNSGRARLGVLRPSAKRFTEKGRYGDLYNGWAAQFALLDQRRVDEARCARLPTSEGKALQELVSSEYLATVTTESQRSIGSTTLTRATYAGGAGMIKPGTRFRVAADPTVSPEVKEAQLESSEPVYVGATALGTPPIPLVATRTGVEANLPLYTNRASPVVALADTLWDTTFAVTPGASSEMAGGSTGPTDPSVRQLATALYTGQWGPTDGALLAGALSDAGVKHVALARDALYGQDVLFIADESWAYGATFGKRVKQLLRSKWLGFGCRCDVRPIQNHQIAVVAQVTLADPRDLDDTTPIRDACRTKLRAYFDERPDFYTWNISSVGGIVARADSRILTCSTVSVVDFVTGAPVTPASLLGTDLYAPHYMLADNGVTLTLEQPQ